MYQHTVDFIVVGAGSAGAALASRLSESGRYQVLLLEAGGDVHPLSRVPISFARFINRPGVNWLYASEPGASTGFRAIPVPRGRMPDSSSSCGEAMAPAETITSRAARASRILSRTA